MQKFLIVVIVLCVLLGAEEITKNIDFGVNDLSFARQSGYDCVSIKETWSNFELDRPNLPVKVVNLVIPQDAEIQGLQFNTNQVEIPGSYKIVPVEKPLGYDTIVAVEMMPLDSAKVYPEQIAQISNIGYFAGNQIVSIIVYPLQYLPKQQKLILNKNIQLTIRYKKTGMNGITKKRNLGECAYKILQFQQKKNYPR